MHAGRFVSSESMTSFSESSFFPSLTIPIMKFSRLSMHAISAKSHWWLATAFRFLSQNTLGSFFN